MGARAVRRGDRALVLDRLAAGDEGWLAHHRDRWRESGQRWDRYFQGWLSDERLYSGRDIMRGLQT